MTELDEERLAGIAERCAMATPGPWQTFDGNVYVQGGFKPICYDIDVDREETDGPFIAASRADIPWLLELVQRLQGDRDHARRQAYYLHALWDDINLPWPHKPEGEASDGWKVEDVVP